MLEIKNLRKNFESGTEALKGVDLTINKGELIRPEHLTAKRPGNGINPMKIKTIIGTRAKKNYAKDDQIKLWKKYI